MPKSKTLIDEQGQVRELSIAEIRQMRPAQLALPASLLVKLRTPSLKKTFPAGPRSASNRTSTKR
ncbi:MAG: hypothetical protein RLZZ352_1664 [Pseudomonadota bacterium]|jgi:hypothetical protein